MSSKISDLTAGGAGIATDRIPVARSPFGSGDNAYLLFSAFASINLVGLAPTWVSATQLGASAGLCYIESLGYAVYGAPADITPSSPSASTWYHIYAYSNAGVLTLEASTTAPVAFATPYGTARSKSGDTSRRYLYSALTNGSSTFYSFAVEPASNLMSWVGVAPNASPFRVLSNGSATTSTVVDCSGAIPITARALMIQFQVTPGGTAGFYLGHGDYTVDVSTSFSYGIGTGVNVVAPIACNASQQLQYKNTNASAGSYIDVQGFWFSR